jgi:hypothetical protein
MALTVGALVALAVLGWGVFKLLPSGGRHGRTAPERPGRGARPGNPPPAATATASVPSTQKAVSPFPVDRGVPGQTERQNAALLYQRGLDQLARNQLLGARGDLADAYFSGALSEAQAAVARQKLTDLANKTLFSRTIYPDDPCVFEHTVKAGDVLVKLERALMLHVPAELILKVNGIAGAAQVQAGQRLKLIRGPFHAAVSKTHLVMDVYLQEHETGRLLFVRRLPVGTGKNGSTPAGHWRLQLGGKIRNAAWTPPSSSDLPRRKILPGQPGYALGKRGLWISLEGVDGNTYTAEDGYGIHDTYDQNSIGTNSSLGCIRLRDDDIDFVFSTLYEFWSTVAVEP